MLPPIASNSKGQFRLIDFTPPLTLQVGDEVIHVGDQLSKTTQVGASVSANGLADTPIVYTEPA